ncbi:MAG: DUF4190 domain-containing protein [Lysobacteraceae bacterium]
MNDTLPPPSGQAPTSVSAIVSLASGIASWVLLPFIAAIIAVVSGHMARSEIRRSQGMVQGDAMAIIGLILGYVNLALIIGGILLLVLFFGGLAGLIAILGQGNF